MMRFWRIKSPSYESDYRHSYINGSLEHPFGLPGIECDVCGDTWGGSRILPYDCPPSFRHHKNIVKKWPITREEHAALQKQMLRTLHIEGQPFAALRPGDDFQPCFLDVPSCPCADFLWPSLGSLVVSERIKNVLVTSWPNDIVACPVSLRKIGKREAKLAPPMPSTGEPEDIINEVPLSKDVSQIGPYFEILVQKESGFPLGGTPLNTCAGCGRPNVDNSTRELRMTPEMWKGDHLFFLATTLYVLITDKVREQLDSMRPTNVLFEEMETPNQAMHQRPHLGK
jgi:hypothetical protein